MIEMFLCIIAVILFFGVVFLVIGIRAIEESIELNTALIVASINNLAVEIEKLKERTGKDNGTQG